MDDIGLFGSTLGADGGAAGDAAIGALTPSDALGQFDVITPVVKPVADLLDYTGQAEMNGVTATADAVSSVIPSKTTLFSAGILIAVILVLVLLVVGKVEQL